MYFVVTRKLHKTAAQVTLLFPKSGFWGYPKTLLCSVRTNVAYYLAQQGMDLTWTSIVLRQARNVARHSEEVHHNLLGPVIKSHLGFPCMSALTVEHCTIWHVYHSRSMAKLLQICDYRPNRHNGFFLIKFKLTCKQHFKTLDATSQVNTKALRILTSQCLPYAQTDP